MSIDTLPSFPTETSDPKEVDAGFDRVVDTPNNSTEAEVSAAHETLSESAQESLRELAEQDIEQAMLDIQAKLEDQQQATLYYEPLEKKIKKNEEKLKVVTDAKKAEDEKNHELGLHDTRKSRRLGAKESRAVYKYNKKARKYNKAKKLITTNIAEKSVREWSHDPNRQTEGYKTLLADMDSLQTELQKRAHIREALTNADLPADTRATYEAEATLWSGQSDSEYEASKKAEITTKYHEWLAKQEQEKQVVRFRDAKEQLKARLVIIKKSQDSTDTAEKTYNRTLVQGWDKTLEEFRADLLGDELESFQKWVLKESDEELAVELKNIDKQAKERERTLEREKKLREKAAGLITKADSIKKNLESETDTAALEKLKDEYEKLEASYREIVQEHQKLRDDINSWGEKGDDELRKEAINSANTKHRESLEGAGL